MKKKPPKANTFAILGFFSPFVAAGITCGLLLISGEDFGNSGVFLVYLIAVPLILIVGLVLGIKSIPRIHELGDKDYAYTGLFLDIFSLFVFFLSCIYFS